jgi:hypothetical protein
MTVEPRIVLDPILEMVSVEEEGENVVLGFVGVWFLSTLVHGPYTTETQLHTIPLNGPSKSHRRQAYEQPFDGDQGQM